jgi:hypothetical protein
LIWIAQILCPDRHCIQAAAFDDAQTPLIWAQAELIATAEHRVRDGAICRECVICGSAAWRIEVGRTRFATMDAARPEIERLERENDATRRFFAAVLGVGR